MSSDSNITNINFNQAISERYLSYALSTIMSRSLPDSRDGLKPVHRRLLFAMLKLRLDPESGFKKCARVVGDVIGKYHPHGDVAVYDTLVRLAQDFSLRYPLIDGQGNFGSIDGDSAAAMRYTESRMTELCTYLVQDLDQDTVDFRPTYDNSEEEPVLFPAVFPNLLVNGAEGIAVGMATSIPPHNLDEVCQAIIYLIENPDCTDLTKLMNFIKGPDLPTGGIILKDDAIFAQTYETGRGNFKVRARWEIENFSHGLYQIVVTEIPYQVQKSKLIEQIAMLMREKKLPLVGNIRDESTEEIRLIIEPKGRSCDAEVVMQSLFKLTDLETRLQFNLNVISASGVPKVMGLREVLDEFIEHRKIVVTRRSRFKLGKIEHRLEILLGFKIAYLNIDQIINIIRISDEPKLELMKEFALTDIQSEAILNMKLRSLRKLEEIAIEKEIKKLREEQKLLKKILSSNDVLMSVIREEMGTLIDKFGNNTQLGKRRTDFEFGNIEAQAIDISAFIEREPITVICSKQGWIRSVKGHKFDLSNLKYKDGDSFSSSFEVFTTDNILIFSSDGKVFTLLADNISKGKTHGDSIRLMFDFNEAQIIDIIPHKAGQNVLLASKLGKGFIVASDDLIAQTKSGKQIMNSTDKNPCAFCKVVDGDMVACISNSRRLLVFRVDELPVMKKGQGVTMQKYRDSELSDIKIFNSEEGLSWQLGNKIRLEKDIMSWQTRRGGVGKIPPVGFPRNNKFE